jgi:hypothetical protein
MWQAVSEVRFHYQTDDVDRIEGRIKYELFKIAQLLVNSQYYGGNERFYAQVLVDKEKIKGRFSKNMFLDACQEYIELNPKYHSKLMNKYKFRGHSKEEAYELALAELKILLMRYYGNPIPQNQIQNFAQPKPLPSAPPIYLPNGGMHIPNNVPNIPKQS